MEEDRERNEKRRMEFGGRDPSYKKSRSEGADMADQGSSITVHASPNTHNKNSGATCVRVMVMSSGEESNPYGSALPGTP